VLNQPRGLGHVQHRRDLVERVEKQEEAPVVQHGLVIAVQELPAERVGTGL
jgi:hypothetical protein